MISRYSRPEMSRVWSQQTRYELWLEIECHALDAMAQLGVIPESAAKNIRARAKFDPQRINEIEREVKHDVLAFLTNVAEGLGEDGRFLHQGLTSSDILDTSLSVQLMRASDILLQDLDQLCEVLQARAEEHKRTLCVGRSHGIHAEPTSFGLKLLQAWAEFSRHRRRLEEARGDIAVAALSGPVGTFAYLDPKVESYVAQQMGLIVEPISTQIIPRDRHAMFFATLAVVASSVERLAIEVRHLQRSEVGEAEESFTQNQKGSSSMPHKRNPVLSENITGLARWVRAQAWPAMENVALWHERDISHSSVERIIAPDTTIALDFALTRLTSVMADLLVYPDNMRKNLDMTSGLVYSHGVLLALTQKGMAREQAYLCVQRHAMGVWEKDNRQAGDFLAALKKDKEITQLLDDKALEEIFSPQHHFAHIDEIFARTLESGGG